jgi:site-specific DNA-methyltransferase (adenine-specific)
MKKKDANPLTIDIDLFLALIKMRNRKRPPIYMAMPDNCLINRLPNEIVDLGIYDPPFGIQEKSFDKKHYTRDESFVIDGYVEAPKDYYKFSKDWISEAVRILKPNGSMYIVSGWSNSDIIGRVIRELNLFLINKIIWNFSFAVYTSRKYPTAHYEIFYVKKNKKAKPTFNTDCRFKTTKEQYADMKSVWKINKTNRPGKKKNKNKLPEELIKKMIQYSSNDGDVVCDFFMGNFTTKEVCKKLNRHCIGYEMNIDAFMAGVIKEEGK